MKGVTYEIGQFFPRHWFEVKYYESYIIFLWIWKEAWKFQFCPIVAYWPLTLGEKLDNDEHPPIFKKSCSWEMKKECRANEVAVEHCTVQ